MQFAYLMDLLDFPIPLLRLLMSLFVALVAVFRLPLHAEAALYALDTHVHFDYRATEGTTGQEAFVKAGLFQHGFLIAPSYAIWPERETQPGFEWLRETSNIALANQAVSNFVQSHPGKFIGLCGVTLHWTDPRRYVLPCLDLPGMKGLKIHSDDSALSLAKRYKDVRSLFAAVKGRHPIILWHVMTSTKESFSDLDELASIYRLAKEFPQITFVLAHSLYGAEAINALHSWEIRDGADLKNVNIEISTFYANISHEFDDKLVQSWRSFGFDRIQFGSDMAAQMMGPNEEKIL